MGLCLQLKSATDQVHFNVGKPLLDSSPKGKLFLTTADPSALNYQLDSNAGLSEVLERMGACCDKLLCCGIYLF